MSNPTSPPDSEVGTRLVDGYEQTLREHVRRSEVRLRELESDRIGLQRDHGTLQEDRDDARRLIESIRSDMHRAQRAIERIKSGTYGRCAKCGEAIASARLAAIPESEHCHRCA